MACEYKTIICKVLAGTKGVAAQLNNEAKDGWRVKVFVERKNLFILEREIR